LISGVVALKHFLDILGSLLRESPVDLFKCILLPAGLEYGAAAEQVWQACGVGIAPWELL
jgi:hypothetical protein